MTDLTNITPAALGKLDAAARGTLFTDARTANTFAATRSATANCPKSGTWPSGRPPQPIRGGCGSSTYAPVKDGIGWFSKVGS